MVMEERQDKIINLLMKQQSATVSELSELFDVSPVTIRSDLNQMAEQGRNTAHAWRRRLAAERTRQEYSFTTQQRINAPEKQQIGRVAAALVQPGEAILLDASTTAFAVGQALETAQTDLYNVTVVTTGIWTALELLGTALPGSSPDRWARPRRDRIDRRRYRPRCLGNVQFSESVSGGLGHNT